jgi:hypothetical protein
VSAGQQWAGCLAGLAIALTSAGAAAAQRPLPDPSPAARAQTPAPDPAPGATARQVVRRPPTVAIQSAPATPVRTRPAAVRATPQRTVGGGGGATARTKTTARVTAATTPAATRTKARTPSRRQPAHRRPTHRAAPPPQLRLDAVRRAIAALAPVAVAARPRAGDDTLRAVLTVAGAALLALAATGSVTLGRATARARA